MIRFYHYILPSSSQQEVKSKEYMLVLILVSKRLTNFAAPSFRGSLSAQNLCTNCPFHTFFGAGPLFQENFHTFILFSHRRNESHTDLSPQWCRGKVEASRNGGRGFEPPR